MKKVLTITLLSDYFISIFILIYSILKKLPAHTYTKITIFTLITLDILILLVSKIVSIVKEVQRQIEQEIKEEQERKEEEERKKQEAQEQGTINMDLTYDENDVKELLNDEQNQDGDAIDQDSVSTEQ